MSISRGVTRERADCILPTIFIHFTRDAAEAGKAITLWHVAKDAGAFTTAQNMKLRRLRLLRVDFLG